MSVKILTTIMRISYGMNKKPGSMSGSGSSNNENLRCKNEGPCSRRKSTKTKVQESKMTSQVRLNYGEYGHQYVAFF